MCRPPAQFSGTPRRAVVVGAGPGGLLAAIHLLRRGGWQVTLVDPGKDYSGVHDLKAHRSWMIGLASHGVTALREVPGLWDYVAGISVPVDAFSVHFGKREMKRTGEGLGGLEGYLVDRNYVVASLARYLGDRFGMDAERYIPRYGCRALYVDGGGRRVLVRDEASGAEGYVGYDLLIGADGIRSVVRGSILLAHRGFECRVDDIFNRFKAVHVRRPATLGAGQMGLLPEGLPNMNGIALPEKGDSVCMTFGYQLHQTCAEELMGDEPKAVSEYVRKNFKAYELVDYDDFARQWCAQPWSSTGQVHCNMYHSSKLGCLILGDAAHATSPSIGMGMNTAMADASVLSRLLDKHCDDLEAVLPAFSEERVKEGQALTDLAFYLFPFDIKMQVRYLVEGAVRTTLHKYFPGRFNPDPQQAIGLGTKLSEVYGMAKAMGIIDKAHTINDKIRRDYWEKRWGMLTSENEHKSIFNKAVILLPLLVAVTIAYYQQNDVYGLYCSMC